MLNFINSSWTFACSYLFERSNRCEHAKGNMQKTGNFHLKKTEKNNKIYAITLRLQVIQIYSHQLLKHNWIDFTSKQSFYFTKSFRGPDPTTQRAGFGPRAVCLTPLHWTNRNFLSPIQSWSANFQKIGIPNQSWSVFISVGYGSRNMTVRFSLVSAPFSLPTSSWTLILCIADFWNKQIWHSDVRLM